MSKLQPGSKVPLHPVDNVPEVMPGELLPRSAHLKRAHIVTLEVKKRLLFFTSHNYGMDPYLDLQIQACGCSSWH